MEYHTEPIPKSSGKKNFSYVPANYRTNQLIVLQLYVITKKELKSKKQAKLPEYDRRRVMVQPQRKMSVSGRLIKKTAVDILALKRSFVNAFASLQLKMNSFL